jgi:hypothetical protein
MDDEDDEDDEDDASNLEGEQTWNEMAREVEPLVRGPAMVPQHQLPQSQKLPSLTKFDTEISASLHHPFSIIPLSHTILSHVVVENAMQARHGLRELNFQTLRCERESCGR